MASSPRVAGRGARPRLPALPALSEPPGSLFPPPRRPVFDGSPTSQGVRSCLASLVAATPLDPPLAQIRFAKGRDDPGQFAFALPEEMVGAGDDLHRGPRKPATKALELRHRAEGIGLSRHHEHWSVERSEPVAAGQVGKCGVPEREADQSQSSNPLVVEGLSKRGMGAEGPPAHEDGAVDLLPNPADSGPHVLHLIHPLSMASS